MSQFSDEETGLKRLRSFSEVTKLSSDRAVICTQSSGFSRWGGPKGNVLKIVPVEVPGQRRRKK